MIKEATIDGLMTTAQAAEYSGLSPHRIGCLARVGEIDAFKNGNMLLIDSLSLAAYVRASQGRGRPMDSKTAWAALWLLVRREVGWLDYYQMRRLRKRVESASAEVLLWQLRRRAYTRRYRVSASFLPVLEGAICLTGTSSNSLSQFGLMPVDDFVEGYCTQASASGIIESCRLVEDAQGNVTLRVADWLPQGAIGEMPPSVVAADLALSLNSRERSAGLQKFKEMLDAFRSI